jgi:hypothetical protein
MNEMHSIVEYPPRTAPDIVEARMMCTDGTEQGSPVQHTFKCRDLHDVDVVSPASREFSRDSRCRTRQKKVFFLK